MSTSFFSNIGNSSHKSYSYSDQIKTPSEIGMSGEGKLSVLARDIGGIIGYTQILVQGGGVASKIPGPLGDKYFMKTGSICKDVATGKRVVRSIFINNIPDGSIPFISSGVGVRFKSFRGLVPGLLSNLAKIDPTAIFSAFSAGTTPKCKAVTLETRDANNKTKMETAFLILSDIKQAKEGFASNRSKIHSAANLNSDASDILTYMYYIAVLGILIYIIARLKR